MTTPRARARAQTMDDIKRIARTQLATEGAAALSLRAVARELGVVSSAVYRYVRSRDELLTLLVVDGYDALGDAVDAAVAAAPDDPAARLRAAAHAVRDWGLAEPAWYGLLFGTPVPGYAAPAEQTVAPGTRVIATLLRLLETAHHAGALTEPTTTAPASPATLADFARIRTEFDLDIPDWLLARALVLWSALFGAVSFDVFDMYGAGTFSDRADVFDLQLTGWLELLGFG
ncbi:TetR/AcrR family transcriptional regulator [Nocardia cyriacigeorgica]|uniref:Transcriptional regulator, TetR family n=1 Tax=Nocardia cyriacigeorgica (strain GUH-2) TaxID=1127134 RepID=H6R6W4_NOCCG|nr:TetR/AcrR family transcriptional regulator [Nocardia cyriacigeorgica]CCF63477.1 Transcriptional regulator, TetR family [Nocardia cyriacigeorgica GUH-2]